MRFSLYAFLFFSFIVSASADKFAEDSNPPSKDRQRFLMDCSPPTAQIDLAVNNVRARLLIGGDLWWDGSEGKYIVPEPAIPQFAVSSMFAAGIWTGGFDPGGNLKLAAKTYGTGQGRTDFFAGPLDLVGSTDRTSCQNWDRFFAVTRKELETHFQLLKSGNYSADQIPPGIKGWPASGNPHFSEMYGFDLPNNGQQFAGYFDANVNGLYEPLEGDFPSLEIRGCENSDAGNATGRFPDQMIYWIFNDAGNVHSETFGDNLKLESQVTAFAYENEDAINEMTFYRYKNVYRGLEDLNEFRFGLWVDPDLGCFTDDYVGVDSTRSLSFIYNEDATDGQVGCSCPQGVNTYCSSIPVAGIDVFRGVDGGEMTSFSYFNGGSFDPPPGAASPNTVSEIYNYLSGKWRDGSPYRAGGDGYGGTGRTTNFAFFDPPNCIDSSCWSMCSSNLPQQDTRMIHSTGGANMAPGSITEFIFGVVWAPSIEHPCPDLTPFFDADDLAQSAFDNCFEIKDDLSSTDDALAKNQIQVYPNPGSVFKGVSIANVPNSASLKIFDESGRLLTIFEKENTNSKLSRTVFWQPEANLSSGIYLIQIEQENREVLTFKWTAF